MPNPRPPQLSIWCPSPASHTTRSMSGTARTPSLQGSSASANSGSSVSRAEQRSWRDLPPSSPSSSLALRAQICPQLCLYQTSPALRNAFSPGRAIPAPAPAPARSRSAGKGAGLCPVYCQPGSLSQESAQKTSSPRKIRGFPRC